MCIRDSVKGEGLSQKESAYSISTITSKNIEDLGLSRTADIVEQIPGVKITEYNQGGISNAVVMRGFSSGIHGGDMGIYLDGIPLNEYYGHGGGYGDPNVIIPLELDRVLAYKGPSSALYGNFSRAGTIAFFTKQKGDYNKYLLKYGSNETFDAQTAIGTGITDKLWNNTAVQFYRTGGYTENSEHFLGNASTRLTYNPFDKFEVSLSMRAHKSDWDAPGYISKTQWEDKDLMYKQDPAIGDDGGNRQQFSERLDMAYSINKEMKVILWGFALQSDWTRWANFGGGQSESYYNIQKYGAGANFNYKNSLVSAVGGFDFFRDDTDAKKYDSVDRVRGTETQNISTVFDNHAFFGEGEINLIKYFRPLLGLRVDMFSGKENNRIDGTTGDFSLSDYSHFSPKAGFRSTILDKILDFRFSVSNGFIMPPADAMHNNSDVDPATIWQYETGLTGSYEKLIVCDMSWYLIDTKNEVQETAPNSGIYQNLGETRRMGFEADIKINPIKMIELKGSYGYARTEIRKNSDSALEGKEITGIPEMTADAGIRFTSPWGAGVSMDYRYVGQWYTKSDNSDKYDGHHLVDMGIFYKVDTDKQNIYINFEITNLTNTHYASFASEDWGMWSTGAPRRYWLSANMKW